MKFTVIDSRMRLIAASVIAIVVAAVMIAGVFSLGHETPTNSCVPSKELLAGQASTNACVPASKDNAEE